MTLKRFGNSIVGTNVNLRVLEEMDLKKYLERVHNHVKEKKVFVVDYDSMCVGSGGWSERWLSEWFEKNYRTLGFDKVLRERTPEYKKKKALIGFYGYPDYLGKTKGCWIRVEIEVFSSRFRYNHTTNYAEVVLCYEANEPIEGVRLLALKDLIGCSNIINSGEIWDYLYVVDTEFRNEMENKTMQSIAKIMKERYQKKRYV